MINKDFPINPRLTIFIIICFVLFAVLMPTWFMAIVTMPFKDYIKQDIQQRCMTELIKTNPQIVDNMFKHPDVLTALIEDNVSVLEKTVVVTQIVTVTPTQDGRHYFADDYQTGIRMLAHPFSWYRSDVNLPNNNLKVSANVYDYAIFNSYHFQDLEESNSVNQAYKQQFPQDSNNDFLFLFVSIYEDDVISVNTPNLWLPTEKNFMIQIEDKTYPPIDYPKQINIKELEHTTNENQDYYISAFGQNPQYVPQNYHSNELYNNGTPVELDRSKSGFAGMVSQPHYFIKKGQSNKEDGYILFEIPKNTPLEKIRVLGNFFAFGNSEWTLWNENSDYFKNVVMNE